MREYKTIFIGIDFSSLDQLFVRTAAEIGRTFHAERIHLVHVVPLAPDWTVGSTDVSVAAFASVFQAEVDDAKLALERIRGPEGFRVTREARTGPAARELAAAAADANADLLIVGSHPRGRLGRFLLGSVASTLVRVSPCPVLVVAADRPLVSPIGQVLAAIDGSPVSAEVVDHAAAFAKAGAGQLRVLSGYDRPRRELAPPELIETCEARYRIEIEELAARAHLEGLDAIVDVRSRNDPKAMIAETIEATRPGLVAIGTSGHNAWERLFLGSTASHVLAHASCPVLVVPTKGRRR